MEGTKGTKLIATCEADKMGGKLGFFTIKVDDDWGNSIAIVDATVARVGK